ncbi:beta-lactamase family protein [Rhodocytophaga rosea]|uniref:Beta-lactamase family protein n=1 Tax=Rhodocytophaga rosea TaxID=2704465 RepID=A0A6C0GS78_9BACT|nr:serine hydrolase domain-containing protein [Rhodocytophaga rosea]QHT70955.1 beta-lactamase family protein [Rhodocytophaga rosea]
MYKYSSQILLVFICLAAILLETHTASAQSIDAKTKAYIDSLTAATFTADQPGGVLLVAKKGVPVYRKAFGLANVELKVPNQPEYKFRIGSITKQFTAVAVLQLVQQGELSLTDDIRKYLPTFNTHGETITIEQLLTHTSGIQSYTSKQDFESKMRLDFSQEEMLKYFMDDSLNFEPNTNFLYNNSGYYLLGMLIEKASGLSYEQYLQKNIWQPLGMTNTLLGTYDQVIPDMASGYDPGPDGSFKPGVYLSFSQPFSAGAIISTVDDLLKWDHALYTDKLLPQSLLQKAWTAYKISDGRATGYGYGWGIGAYKDVTLLQHGGGIPGFICLGIRIPEEQVYAILLTNAGGAKDPGIIMPIALRVAGREITMPTPVSLSASKLQQYTGAFEVPGAPAGINEVFTLSGDTLISNIGEFRKLKFWPVGKDRFFTKEMYSYLQFVRDEKGKINAIEYSSLYRGDMINRQKKISQAVVSK